MVEFADLLAREQYVERKAFHEEVKPELALAFSREGFRYKTSDGLPASLNDIEIHLHGSLIILGNAGSGKSLIMRKAYCRAAEDHMKDEKTPIPLWLDLAKVGTQADAISLALNAYNSSLWNVIKEDTERSSILFMDSLDERMRFDLRFINDLNIFLQLNSADHFDAIIACRRAMYRKGCFSGEDFPIYFSDYLPRECYSKIIPDHTRCDQFLQEIHEMGLGSLLETPFDGFYLARRYEQGQSLPKTRYELIGLRIDNHLKGHRESESGFTPPSTKKMQGISIRLACAVAFSRHEAGFTEQDAVDIVNAAHSNDISPRDVNETLSRPLFTIENGNFSFVHQLMVEYLVAEKLKQLPLRKQIQLLESDCPGSPKCVQPRYRGIAAILASGERNFARWVVADDPLVFLTSEGDLPDGVDLEHFLAGLIKDLCVRRRLPWESVRPHGIEYLRYLGNRRPDDPSSLLRSFLESNDEYELIWGTACVAKWDGCATLNPALLKIAQDFAKPSMARRFAIEAISSADPESNAGSLKELCDDEDAVVRGTALEAVLENLKLRPKEFLPLFLKRPRDLKYLGEQDIVAINYGDSLDKENLAEAFTFLAENMAMPNLKDWLKTLLKGMLTKAAAIGLESIPAEIFDWICEYGMLDTIAAECLNSSSQLRERIWAHAFEKCKDAKVFHYGRLFGQLYGDDVFSLVPPGLNLVNEDQRILLEHCITSAYFKDPTPDRLTEYRRKCPQLTTKISPPEIKREPNEDEFRIQILEILEDGAQNSHQKILKIRSLAKDFLREKDNLDIGSKEGVAAFSGIVEGKIGNDLAEMFLDCINSLTYKRTQKDPSTGRYTMTQPVYLWPVKVLYDLGQTPGIQKIKEIITCYSFLSPFDGFLKTLLNHLWKCAPSAWRELLRQLLDKEEPNSHYLIDDLIERNDNFYLPEGIEKITGRLDSEFRRQLIRLIVHFSPPDLEQILISLFEQIRLEENELESCEATMAESLYPLVCLLSKDKDGGWEILDKLLKEDAPPLDHIVAYRQLDIPTNPERIRIICDWYAQVHRRSANASEMAGVDLSNKLLAAIREIGGNDAIREIRRLADTGRLDWSDWAHHLIDEIREDMLDSACVRWGISELMRFLNDPQLAIIHTEKDLFEWTVAILDELRDGIEKRREGLHGFWNGDQPKNEPEIHNVFWPRIKDKTERHGVLGIDERKIDPNFADFFLMLPRANDSTLKLAIEVKKAHYSPENQIIPRMRSQLVEQYMIPENLTYGIYLIFWFKSKDGFPGPSSWETQEDLLQELEVESEKILKDKDLVVRPFLIDVSQQR